MDAGELSAKLDEELEKRKANDSEGKVAAENAPVQLIMTLALDFSMTGSEPSDKLEKLKRDVAEDLASASGLPAANFRIKDVSQNNGSIILDMEVMPDPLAPGAHLLAVKDLAEQAKYLQVVEPSSKLRSGKITRHATGVEVIPPTPQAIDEEADDSEENSAFLGTWDEDEEKKVVDLHRNLREDFGKVKSEQEKLWAKISLSVPGRSADDIERLWRLKLSIVNQEQRTRRKTALENKTERRLEIQNWTSKEVSEFVRGLTGEFGSKAAAYADSMLSAGTVIKVKVENNFIIFHAFVLYVYVHTHNLVTPRAHTHTKIRDKC